MAQFILKHTVSVLCSLTPPPFVRRCQDCIDRARATPKPLPPPSSHLRDFLPLRPTVRSPRRESPLKSRPEVQLSRRRSLDQQVSFGRAREAGRSAEENESSRSLKLPWALWHPRGERKKRGRRRLEITESKLANIPLPACPHGERHLRSLSSLARGC